MSIGRQYVPAHQAERLRKTAERRHKQLARAREHARLWRDYAVALESLKLYPDQPPEVVATVIKAHKKISRLRPL